MCNEVIDAEASVSTNVSSSVPINAANTASLNFEDKKVRYKMNFCILHNVLLVVIFFIYNHYCLLSLHKAQVKMYWSTNDTKMEKTKN